MPHQVLALQFATDKANVGMFMEPGTGKTLVAKRWLLARRSRHILVVCRRDDFYTWSEELKLEGIRPSAFQMIDSGKPGALSSLSPSKTWTFVTYDLPRNSRVFDFISNQHWDAVIADESHYIRHWSSRRTKQVIRLTQRIPNRMAMTGTPIGNSMEDLFSQMLFIDGGRSLGNNFYRFRNRYFWPEPTGYRWHLFKEEKQALIDAVKPVVFFLSTSEAMLLPKKRYLVKAAPMTASQRKAYNSILENWEVVAGDYVMQLDYVISQVQKLQQVAGGFVYDEQKRPHWFPSGKLRLLKRMFIDGDGVLRRKPKVVIWCAYTAEIKRIHRMLTNYDIPSVVYHGGKGATRAERIEARRLFKTSSSIRCFIGQVESGLGMNELVVADTAVYYSNSRKSLARQQSERRTWRKGSERHSSILYVDLATEHSIDTHILRALRKHKDVALEVSEQLKKGRKPADVTC